MNNNSKVISYFLFACIFYCAIVMTFVLIRDDRGSLTSESIQKVYKSVVGIHVIQSVDERYDFQSFWDDYIVEKAVENMGSGLVLSEDGYIVTNYHVIEKASKQNSSGIKRIKLSTLPSFEITIHSLIQIQSNKSIILGDIIGKAA